MIKLSNLFELIESESELKIIDDTTNKTILEGLCGVIDFHCEFADWEVVYISPGSVTKIYVRGHLRQVEEI